MIATAIRTGSETPRVLIVGAGPTGLMLALSLTRAKIPVRIVDRSAAPATTSRAIGIQARTLELLELFGLADSFVGLGLKAVAGNIYSDARRLVHLDLERLESRFPFILLLEQTETERQLTAALTKFGVVVERGIKLVSFDELESGVSVRLAFPDGGIQSGQYEYLAGCDGAHSAVRHGLGLGFAGKTLRQNFLLADADVDWSLPDDQFHIFTSREGLMAIFPMRNGHRLIAETSEPHDPQYRPTLAELDQLASRRTSTEVKLSHLRWSSSFRVNSRLATRIRSGRVFLAGDAAHVHSPAGAQGMNTGIQDAINLGWKLALVLGGRASVELLETYEKERYPVEQAVLRKTEALTQIVGLGSPLLQFFRDRIAPVLTRRESVQRLARRTISQIAVSYRSSGSNWRGASPDGLRAGDRMPDFELELMHETSRRRLYEILDPARFTLLILAGSQAARKSEEIYHALSADIVSISNAVLPRDRGADWFFLIRPDAYLAIHGPLARLRDAGTWLARFANR